MNNKGVLNNKGFTLVELLAVVTILAAFSVVAVTNVSASLRRNKTQKEATQKEMLITAAKIYFSNNNLMANGNLVCVDDLVADKYVSYESISEYYNTKKCVKIGSSSYDICPNPSGSCNCNSACN